MKRIFAYSSHYYYTMYLQKNIVTSKSIQRTTVLYNFHKMFEWIFLCCSNDFEFHTHITLRSLLFSKQSPRISLTLKHKCLNLFKTICWCLKILSTCKLKQIKATCSFQKQNYIISNGRKIYAYGTNVIMSLKLKKAKCIAGTEFRSIQQMCVCNKKCTLFVFIKQINQSCLMVPAMIYFIYLF